MRLNRSIPACTTVVIVFSIAFFWLPSIFVFDLTHILAGGLAGRLGATTFRGAFAGVVGGLVVALLWSVVFALAGAFSAGTLLVLVFIPVTTTVCGAVGGWVARTP